MELLLTLDNLSTLDTETYQKIALKLARIDRDSVEDELGRFPSFYTYYYGFLVHTKAQLDLAELELEERKSEIRRSGRGPGVKLTVAAGEDLVNSSEEIQELNRVVQRLSTIYSFMKGICNTLEHKKDMLVQLSANKRQETKLYQ